MVNLPKPPAVNLTLCYSFCRCTWCLVILAIESVSDTTIIFHNFQDISLSSKLFGELFPNFRKRSI